MAAGSRSDLAMYAAEDGGTSQVRVYESEMLTTVLEQLEHGRADRAR